MSATEFFAFIVGAAAVVTIIVNIVNAQHRNKRDLEKSIDNLATEINNLEFKLKSLASIAKFKQAENASKIADIEGFLSVHHGYIKRQSTNDSGDDFTRAFSDFT
ncbi:hypothetical protein NG798_00580 [Ancylothrix sp. C2]|uniref:hypothetical protein n=1 Tax=Ancylothrix sp. D3o TaxID=2953691 RepID=UPI0021BA5066|nr:hypothetical protein [Ancylothrix sp. D3o]MCT7948288.1 hypothetical protein [Ancylothrix sp. D3o]